MAGWVYKGARCGAVFGAVSLAALMAAGAAVAAEEMVTVTMTKSQYEALMNVLPRIEQLESQVRDNAQNLQVQQGQQQKTDEKIEAVADSVPDLNTVERSKSGVTLELSGQVNMGVLFADSGDSDGGDEDRQLWIVDNDASSSRFRFVAKAPVDDYLTLGAVMELEVDRNASDEVHQDLDDSLDFDLGLRKAEAVIDHKMYGRLRIGQGDTASNGITEQDLSGTTVIAKSEVEIFGGKLRFRDGAGMLLTNEVDDFFGNQDGLSRKMRVRYDTPKWHGTSLATSYSDGGAYDVRLQHSYKWPVAGGVKVAAAAGWYDASATGDEEGISGSASFLHVPTGLSITGAAGQVLDGGDDESFWYLKGGWQGSIFDFGKTAVSADVFMGSDYVDDGSESDTYGIQLVQNIKKTSTQLYIGGRVFMVDNAMAGPFQDIYAVMSGVRQQF